MSILVELFLTFVKIGLFTFGGGYAMLSIVESICVEKKNWITHDEMMNITVIAESTPGPIAINLATFVGYKKGRMPGAMLATFGVVLPSFIIIFAISSFLESFLEIAWIAHAFWGIKMAVGILILDAALKMIKKMPKKPLQVGILIATFVVIMLVNVLKLHLSSIVVMLVAALISLAFFSIEKFRKNEEEQG
ncbi:chromate transporter [Butyrivibrio sp. JL13D10]|uniref:chromate transporter n=1 Tax=Butyrivibrio sp. JL13D10 TaxID=3236815 RepID=UPI0038B4BC48